jgi:ketosteroid isomerase-like protein
MKTMAEKNVTSAEAYYRAMNDKDAGGVARHLHPDVQFVGPMATLAGKDAVLEAAKRFMSLIKEIRIQAELASEDQVMLTYDGDFGEPIGICRTAVWMTLRDDLIARIEIFFDARPFEKNLKKDSTFSSR